MKPGRRSRRRNLIAKVKVGLGSTVDGCPAVTQKATTRLTTHLIQYIHPHRPPMPRCAPSRPCLGPRGAIMPNPNSGTVTRDIPGAPRPANRAVRVRVQNGQDGQSRRRRGQALRTTNNVKRTGRANRLAEKHPHRRRHRCRPQLRSALIKLKGRKRKYINPNGTLDPSGNEPMNDPRRQSASMPPCSLHHF